MVVENRFSTIGKIIYAQILMATIVASGFLVIGDWKSAVSPLIGGAIAIVPNSYFALKVYLARQGEASGILQAFYAGETIKLILTAALFAVAVRLPWVDFPTLLAGYIAVLSVFGFALFYWRD